MSGRIHEESPQDTCSYSGDVKYKVGYKATFQTSYTYERETLKGNGDSTGYTKMVDQWGVRDYKIKLYQITTVSKTTGKLKLKVT